MVLIPQWIHSLNLKEMVTWLVDNMAGQLIVGVILLLISYYIIDRKREARRIKREEETKQKEKLEQEEKEARQIKREEEVKQREKLEQERNKRREELKNDIHEHNQELISEINNWIKNNYASVDNEPLAKEHIQTGYGDIRELYKEFDKGFRDIISDFEKSHNELKGTCKICKKWHDELESLK